MLGKLTHWLSTKLELEDKEDDSLRLRFDALTHMKKVTLDVVQTAHERLLRDRVAVADESSDESATDHAADTSDAPSTDEKSVILTEDDACVHEYCAALESCLKLGLKPQSELWNVLYSSSLVVDEPEFVQSVQTAALLSETDEGKARCWLKIALNKHSLESTLLLIFSVQCDQVVRSSYEEWSLMRCCDGMGLFLQMVMDVRTVHFAIRVNDDPFVTAEPKELATAPLSASGGDTDDSATSATAPLAATSAAAASSASDALSSASALAASDAPLAPDAPVTDDELIEVSSIFFPHRHKGIKPWQHVFGVGLAYLAKNPYHSRFALIDPVLAIPNLVQDCIDFLMDTPNAPRLFRTTVVAVHMNQLREIVETDGALPPDLDAPGAAALLMDFFRTLPEPVLTSEKYEAFIASGQLKDEDASVRNITCLVQDLPMCCKVVLEKVIAMMHFLVAPEHAVHNGLDIATAATTLAPVLAFKNEPLRGPSGQRRSNHAQYQDVRYAAVGAMVIERMITHYDVIFQDVRVQVSDALSRLEAKKDALLSIYQLFKMKPQVNFMSDKQYLEEITKAFSESAGLVAPSSSLPAPLPTSTGVSANNADDSDLVATAELKSSAGAPPPSSSSVRQRLSMPEISVQDPASAMAIAGDLGAGLAASGLGTDARTASGTSTHAPANYRTASGTSTHIGIGARRQTITTSNPFHRMPPLSANGLAESLNAAFDRAVVDAWEKHGFNRPTILSNFEKGGVLLLRSVAHMLKHDPDVLGVLKARALPSETPTYDAGLVAAAICKSLVHLLKLVPSPEHPSINIVALSVEPFWELFDEDAYFYKLFHLMFRMFDALWSALEPEDASFTRVFCDTEARLDELLKKAPSCVDDVRAEWDELWRLLTDPPLGDNDDDEGGSTEDEASSTLPLGHAPPSPPRINKKPSFTFRPEDYATKLMNPSSILTLEHVAHLDNALPITCQLCRWCLLYSTEAHGSSLHTLLMLARGQSPTLLVVKDDQGNVFGGYASDEWHRATQYYGTGETFLFSFSHRSSSSSGGTPGFMKYAWSRRNNYFLLCSEESLVMGGGGSFGLFLDNDLSSGSTGACETFASRPLVSSQEFATVHVELWGFTTSDKPLTQRDPRKKSVLD